jgi:hypothetical protein
LSEPPSESDQRADVDYRDALLRILWGGDPSAKDARIVQTGGFVVIARNTRSLQELQAICSEPNAPRTCLTARYRIRSGPGFGTLIAAFASDLLTLTDPATGDSSLPRLLGDLQPAPAANAGDTPWAKLLSSTARSQLARTLSSPAGTIQPSWILEFLNGLFHTSIPSELVLFAEIEEPGDTRMWADGAGTLLPLLPPAIGIVIAGAPTEFRVMTESLRGVRHLDLRVPDSEPQTEAALRYVEAALSGDQPAKRDRLNVGRYAAALSRLVLLPATRPLTIGIHGPWGSGKSSFMELIRQELIKQAAEQVAPTLSKKLEDAEAKLQTKEHELLTADESRQQKLNEERDSLEAQRQSLLADIEIATHRRVIPVLFNAWQYENATQIWAGLAAEITRRLEGTVPAWARLLARAASAPRLRGAEFWLAFVAPVAAAAVVGLFLFGAAVRLGPQIAKGMPWWLAWLGNVFPVAPAVVTIAFVAWRFYLVARPLGERVAAYMKPLNYRDQMGFQHRVLDDLTFARARVNRWFDPAKGGTSARFGPPLVVVFIDDLDRCSQDHIMEILQAINLILGASDFFVFLGIDTDMIYRAIADHYQLERGNREADLFSESYLLKIIQLSFHLPTQSPESRLAFVSQLFSPAARAELSRQAAALSGSAQTREVQLGPLDFDRRLIMPIRVQVPKTVEDTGDELKAFADFKLFIKGNPRELKRLVNVHRLTKILLQRSEVPLTPPRQRKLVEWLIFCARWPDLVDDVLACARETPQDPDAIERLVDSCDLGVEATNIESFGRMMATESEAILKCADFVDGSDLDLAQAAAISQLVRDRPAPRRAQEESGEQADSRLIAVTSGQENRRDLPQMARSKLSPEAP